MARLPVIALVGRPNVGKSTLYNRLTRSRQAIVADRPGLTRDRHYGRGRIGERPFIVIDTGGFEPVAREGIAVEMARQARQAVRYRNLSAEIRKSEAAALTVRYAAATAAVTAAEAELARGAAAADVSAAAAATAAAPPPRPPDRRRN